MASAGAMVGNTTRADICQRVRRASPPPLLFLAHLRKHRSTSEHEGRPMNHQCDNDAFEMLGDLDAERRSSCRPRRYRHK